jgi:subtilisin family serine protease
VNSESSRDAAKRTWPYSRASAQVRLVADMYGATGVPIGVRLAGDEIDFVFEEGALLVRDGYLDQVRSVVGGGDVTDGLIGGVSHFSLAGAQMSTVTEALDAIDSHCGAGVATPNHVLSVSPVQLCPATEPELVPAGATPLPSIGPAAGSGVSIHVVDTGLLTDAASHPWLAGVTGEEEKLPATAYGEVEIPPYAGHGTFIAGVARCYAPEAGVHVSRVLSLAGATLESEIVRHLDSALGRGPDVISLSAGGTSRNDLPLLGFEMFWERYREHKGTVLVAAAGNNSGRRPFWPAALPEVVSVGALSADLSSRAYFSGFGPWVDVYAPGERLINAYARGCYQYREPPRCGERREFWGMAVWSGTSFSTPVVAGLIAAQMSRTGENSRQAADAVLAAARAQALPGVGPVAGVGPAAGTGAAGSLRDDGIDSRP